MRSPSFWEAFDAARKVAGEGDPRKAFEILGEVTPLDKRWEGDGLLEQAVYASAFDQDRAIATIRGALDKGYCYPRRTLEHEDFKGLAAHPAYKDLVDLSAAAAERAQAETKAEWRVVRPSGNAPASGYPTLIVLQGNNSNFALTEPHWAPVAEHGYVVALLQPAGITFSPGYFSWQGPDAARQQATTQFSEIAREYPVDHERLALGGLSMGAHCATQIAFDGLPAKVLMTFAGFVADPQGYNGRTAAARERGLRVHLVVGEKDGQLENNRRLADALRAEGVTVEFDERSGLGHDYPTDASQTAVRALEAGVPIAV